MADLLNIDPTSVGLDLGDALSSVAGLVKFVLKDRNTPAFQAAFQDVVAEWIIEERRQTVAQLQMLAKSTDDVVALARRLEQLVADPEFVRISANYGYEACREAIDERRRMLAFASAGSVNIDLTIAQLARVERTVRELDPEDVHRLATICNMTDEPPTSDDPSVRRQQVSGNRQLTGMARYGVLEGTSSLAVLTASGCVHQYKPSLNPGNEQLFVTDVGSWVAKVTSGYVVAAHGAE